MNPPAETAPPWLLPVILICAPVLFAGWWSFVCFLLSILGGWGKLARRFSAGSPRSGQRFAWQSGRLGAVNYNMALTIHISPAGLHLAVMPLFRVGHPPLFIPWGEIYNAATRQLLFSERVAFQIGSPAICAMQLPKKIFIGQPVAIDGQTVPPLPPPLRQS